MKFSERYDEIVNCIENTVAERTDLMAIEQLQAIAGKYGFYGANQRDFNAIFSFITGRLPLDYIKHRRMMRAYETLINQDVYNVEEVILIAGYDNQNSFGKKFKSVFNISAKQAWQKRDESKIEKPMFWEEIEEVTVEKRPLETINQTWNDVLGFDMKNYDRFVEFQNYCSAYGVRKEQGEAAYTIAGKYDLEIPTAFEYIKNFKFVTKEMYAENGYDYYFGEPDEGEIPLTVDQFDPKAYFMEMVDDGDTVYCCTRAGLSLDEACIAIDRIEESGYDFEIKECSPAFLYACAYSDCEIGYLYRASEYYLDNSTDDYLDYERFDIFLELLECNYYIEPAFEKAMNSITDSEWDEMFEEDLESGFYADPDEMYYDPIEGTRDEMDAERGEW